MSQANLVDLLGLDELAFITELLQRRDELVPCAARRSKSVEWIH